MKKIISILLFLGMLSFPHFSMASMTGESVKLVKKIIANNAGAGTAQQGAAFGNCTAASRDYFAVAALKEKVDGLSNAGAVYVYGKNKGGTGNWGLVKRITAADAGVGELQAGVAFGAILDITNDTLAVAVPDKNQGGNVSVGAVYVFGRDQGGDDNWGFVYKINSADNRSATYFGCSVAICGETIVIGQRSRSYSGYHYVGCVYVYDPDPDNPGQWKLGKTLIPQNEEGGPERAHGIQFGQAVDISGDVLVVGEQGRSVGGVIVGKISIFYRNTGGDDNWGIVKKHLAQNENGTNDLKASMLFGKSVKISGDLIISGAPGYDSSGQDKVGSAYIYSKDKNGADKWGIVKKLVPVNDLGKSFSFKDTCFGRDVSISGDLALVSSAYGAFIFSKSQSDIATWGILKRIDEIDTEPGSNVASRASIHGDYSVIGAAGKTESNLTKAGAAFIFNTKNVNSTAGCADKTVSPTQVQPTGTSVTMNSVAKKVETTANVKKEHQTPDMDSMLGANVYEFTATVTEGKVAYFCFNSSSLGERKAEDVALFKLFPDKESKKFTYSSGKNPDQEGYFWITDEGNSGQYIDPKMILEGARTYTVNYSVKDNGEFDLNSTLGVITDPVVPATVASGSSSSGSSSGSSSSSSGCVLNPQAGASAELAGLFLAALLGICVRRKRSTIKK